MQNKFQDKCSGTRWRSRSLAKLVDIFELYINCCVCVCVCWEGIEQLARCGHKPTNIAFWDITLYKWKLNGCGISMTCHGDIDGD